jgi:hypothetical protein
MLTDSVTTQPHNEPKHQSTRGQADSLLVFEVDSRELIHARNPFDIYRHKFPSDPKDAFGAFQTMLVKPAQLYPKKKGCAI